MSASSLHRESTDSLIYIIYMGVLKKWQKSDDGKVVKTVKVHFHNSSFSPRRCCCCPSSVSTSVSQ